MRKNGWTILALAVGLLLVTGTPHLSATNAVADPGCPKMQPCGHDSGCREGCGKPCCGKPCEAAPCRAAAGGACPKGAGQAVPPCMQDNAAAVPGGMHRMMHGQECGQMDCRGMAGGPPMMRGMAGHMEEMRGTIAKLRALEAKMETLKSKDDAAAFRAASLEHSKLLTDLQASHLKHMERMMGGK